MLTLIPGTSSFINAYESDPRIVFDNHVRLDDREVLLLLPVSLIGVNLCTKLEHHGNLRVVLLACRAHV